LLYRSATRTYTFATDRIVFPSVPLIRTVPVRRNPEVLPELGNEVAHVLVAKALCGLLCVLAGQEQLERALHAEALEALARGAAEGTLKKPLQGTSRGAVACGHRAHGELRGFSALGEIQDAGQPRAQAKVTR
jgi:hypothetical protein